MGLEPPARLGWGVVGCGDVVEHKSGPAIAHAPRSDMVLVMRRDGDAARDFARRNGVARWSDDARQVIDDEAVDVVYVATPPSSHLEYVLAAAAAGKHVLVEKPMAMNAAEGRAMVAACAAAGVELFVAYYRRFWPHVLRLRTLLTEGVLGRPLLGTVDVSWGDVAGRRLAGTREWRDDPAIGGGGGFVDIGSHRIDLLVWLLGPVAAAHGVATRFARELAVEQIGCAALRMESGALCSVVGDFHSDRDIDRFFVAGERGRVTIDPLDGHALTLETANGTEELRYEPLAAPHLGLVHHVEAVLLDGATNQVAGTDGVITETVLDTVRSAVVLAPVR